MHFGAGGFVVERVELCKIVSQTHLACFRYLCSGCSEKNTKLVQAITIACSSAMLEQARHVMPRHDTTSHDRTVFSSNMEFGL